jgi:cytidylate kinase
MSIITISRGSYSKGKEVAEKAAARLGYACISRDLVVEASAQFNIPEIKLVRALHDAPSVLERFSYGRERYLAYFAAALLERVQRDNVVYHGLAGHFYLKGVSHVLNVRILADMDDRVHLEMHREGISEDEALHILKQDDEERRRWSLKLFGADTWDPDLYDLVIHTKRMSVDNAAEIICHTVGLGPFKTTPQSQRALDNLALAAQARAALVQSYPDVMVSASDGTLELTVKGVLGVGRSAGEIRELVERVPGVKDISVNVEGAGLFFKD